MESLPRDGAIVRAEALSPADAPTVSPGIAVGLAAATLAEAVWLLFLAWMAVRGG